MPAPPKGPPEPRQSEPGLPESPSPPDPKAEMERRLAEHAMEPWREVLGADAQDGLRLAVDLLIKTHPAMQLAIDERLNGKARRATEEKAASSRASGIVTKPSGAVSGPAGERVPPGRSGVVAKGEAVARPTSGRKRKPGS